MVDLILLESVSGLGRPGDKVKVRPGYARNYLLPQRKASPVNPDVLRNLDKLKAKAEEEERAMVSSMTELAGKLQGFEVELSARATERFRCRQFQCQRAVIGHGNTLAPAGRASCGGVKNGYGHDAFLFISHTL